MANKSQVRIEFDAGSLRGKAEFSAKQLTNLEYTGSIRLRPDLIYVIPRQWVHKAQLLRTINGKDTSNKVFIIGFNKDRQVETVFTMALNGLTQQFYGLLEDFPTLLISAVKNADNLYRAVAGTSQTSVWLKGGLPIRTKGSNAYIPYDVAFSLSGRKSVWCGKFKEESPGRWNMLTKYVNDDLFLDLGIQSMNLYTAEELPEYTLESLGDAAETIASYQQELP